MIGALALFQDGDRNGYVDEILEMAARSEVQLYEADQDLPLKCLSIAHIDEFKVEMKAVLDSNAAEGKPWSSIGLRLHTNFRPWTAEFQTMSEVFPSTQSRMATCSG